MIRVCKKSTSPLKCIRFNGPTYDNIEFNSKINVTFEQERDDIMTSMQVQSDPRLRDPRFENFFAMRLKFFDFLLAEETKDVVMKSINGILPFSLLIIREGSRFPSML